MTIEQSVFTNTELSPRRVVDYYLRLLAKNNRKSLRLAYALLSSKDKDKVPLNQWLYDPGLGDDNHGLLTRVDILRVKKTSDLSAEVWVNTRFSDGVVYNDKYTTVDEPYGWRVRIGFGQGGVDSR